MDDIKKKLDAAIDNLADPTTTLEIQRFEFGPKLTRWFLYAHRDGGGPGLQTWPLCMVREEVRS